MTLCTYEIDNTAYQNIPYINDIEENIDHLMPAIREIGALILEYNLQDDYEVSLLHHHFNIYDDELVVEFFDEIRGNYAVKCFKKSDVINISHPSEWRIVENGKLVPLSYSISKHEGANSKKAFPPSLAKRIWRILENSSLENRLGISCRTTTTASDSEMLVERTDEEKRIQWFTTEPILESNNVIETAWSFDANQKEELSGGNLSINVAARCRKVCRRITGGGDSYHAQDHDGRDW